MQVRQKSAVDAATLFFFKHDDITVDYAANIVARSAMKLLGGDNEANDRAANHVALVLQSELDAKLLTAIDGATTASFGSPPPVNATKKSIFTRGLTSNSNAEKTGADLVKLLVKRGAHIDARNKSPPRETALLAAITGRRISCAECLVDLGADVMATDDDGRTPISAVVQSGLLSRAPHFLQTLVASGADIDEPGDDGRTPLAVAAVKGACLEVSNLLKLGANPNIRDVDGCTALARAAEHGQQATASLLVAAGANINLMDDDGRTALDRADTAKYKRMARFLKDNGAIPGKQLLSLYTSQITQTQSSPPQQQKMTSANSVRNFRIDIPRASVGSNRSIASHNSQDRRHSTL